MELWREQSGLWSIQWLFTSCYRSSKYFKNCCTLLFNVAKDQYFAYLWDECIRLSLQGWISLDWFNEVSMILPSPYICHILVIQFLDKIESASLGFFFFLACFCVCVVYILCKYVSVCINIWLHMHMCERIVETRGWCQPSSILTLYIIRWAMVSQLNLELTSLPSTAS